MVIIRLHSTWLRAGNPKKILLSSTFDFLRCRTLTCNVIVIKKRVIGSVADYELLKVSLRSFFFFGRKGGVPIYNWDVSETVQIFFLTPFMSNHRSVSFSIKQIIHGLKTYFNQKSWAVNLYWKGEEQDSFLSSRAKNEIKWKLFESDSEMPLLGP